MFKKYLGYISFLTLCGLMVFTTAAYAQNSLGIGVSEQAIVPQAGLFSGVLSWIQQQQTTFYKLLTTDLKAIRTGEANGMWLVGLSFLYGILHAAGPGHGKVVISMYIIANEVQLKRGIIVAFASAFLQALVAIACITLLVLFLRTIGYRSSDVTYFLEVCSYGAIMLLGAWLLLKKLFGKQHAYPNHSEASCHSDCGHAHFPTPSSLLNNWNIKTALAAVFAVGLRPCSGALIVLTFAFLNGIHFYGVLSALAMAVGTGTTVSTLASMAVLAKQFAVKLSGRNNKAIILTNIIEVGGALLVFVMGLILLLASLK